MIPNQNQLGIAFRMASLGHSLAQVGDVLGCEPNDEIKDMFAFGSEFAAQKHVSVRAEEGDVTAIVELWHRLNNPNRDEMNPK